MARKLKTIAKWINDNSNYSACVEKSWSNTDRKMPRTRLRSIGKGRDGNKITIFDPHGQPVFIHDSSETYRRNEEVEDWVKYNIVVSFADGLRRISKEGITGRFSKKERALFKKVIQLSKHSTKWSMELLKSRKSR